MSGSRDATSPRVFTIAVGTALVLSGTFAALLLSGLSHASKESLSSIGFVVGGLAIAVSGLIASRRSRDRRRRAWLVLALAAASAMVGNAVTAVSGGDPVKDTNPVGDSLIALALILTAYGLLGLADTPLRRANVVVTTLDGVVTGCSVLILAVVLVFSRLVDSEAIADRISALVFPTLDIAVVTVALLLILRSQGDRVFYGLVGFGFVLYAVADLIFAVQNAAGDFAFGTVQDVTWIMAYLLLAAAAWHPAASSPTEAADLADQGSRFDVQGTLLTFGLLIAAAAVQVFYRGGPLTETLTVLWVVLVIAVGARQTLLIGDNQNLRQSLEQRVREQTADLRDMAMQNQALLESVGDGIYAVDLDGRITSYNPSAAQATGYDPADLIGQNAHDVLHVSPSGDGNGMPAAHQHTWNSCYINRALTHAQVARDTEDVYRRTDGSSFPVELTATPMMNEDRITGAVVVFRDVTQRREVERMKDEFLSMVSHELRTPLTSIRGSLGMLGTLIETSPAQAHRVVTIALRSCDRLIRLINDILDVERIRSGKMRMERTPLELRAVLNTALREMTALAEAGGVSLQLGEADGWAVADADRITQTLTNLVGNAVKFSAPGTTVRLGAVASDSEVIVSVADQGRGIPADKIALIFEPFEQVDSSDSREKGGTGIGLAICQGIVERHGGRIWAESEVGHGTTMHFTLPRAFVSELGTAS